MLQNYYKWRVLKVFFDDPLPKGAGYQLREISRKIYLAPTSVKRYLNELTEENLIIRSKHRIHNYPEYWANKDNEYFKFLKKIDTLITIKESRILNYLNEKCFQHLKIFSSRRFPFWSI